MIADLAYWTGSGYIPNHIPGGPRRPGTGYPTDCCPNCGTWRNRETYEAWHRFQQRGALKKLQRSAQELDRLMRQFTEEMES